MTGTFTVIRFVKSILFKSTCNSESFIGSYCQSMIITGVLSPFTPRLKIVLWPVLLFRILVSSFGLTATGIAPDWPPYPTAGMEPFARRRRASFLPRESRGSAVTVISLLIFHLVPGRRPPQAPDSGFDVPAHRT